MNTTQKDPGQFMLTGGRHDQARGRQIIFPRTLESDMKLVAELEIKMMEALKARVQQDLDQVINHVRMLAAGMPSARYSSNAIVNGDKSIH